MNPFMFGLRHAGRSSQYTLCAAGSTLTLLAATPLSADITITPGPSDPAYPAAMPDPWVLPGDLDLNGSSLTVNNGSALDIAGSLLLDDTPVGGPASPEFNFFNATLDIGVDFLAETTGPDADLTIIGNATTIDAGGDITLAGGGDASTSVVSLNDVTLNSTGGSVRLALMESGAENADGTSILTNSSISAANDIILGHDGGTGSANVNTMTTMSFDAGNDVIFDYSHTAGSSNADVFASAGATNVTAGRDILIDLMGSDVDRTTQFTAVSNTYTAGRAITIQAGPVLDADNWTFTTKDLAFNAPMTTIAVPVFNYGSSSTPDPTPLTVVGDIAFTNSPDNPALAFTATNSLFDIDGNLAIQAPGAASGLTVSMSDTEVDAEGDITLAGGGNDSTATVSISDSTLTSTGGDVRLNLLETGAQNAESTFAVNGTSFVAANDFELSQAGGTGSRSVHNVNNVVIDAGNDATLRFADSAGLDNAETLVSTTFTTVDAGRDIALQFTGSDADRVSELSIVSSTLTAGRSIALSAEAVNDADNYTTALFDVDLNAPTVNLDMPLTLYDEIDVDGDLVVSNTAGGVKPVLNARYDTDGGFAFDRMTVTGSVDVRGGGLALVPTDGTTPDPALYDSALVIDAAGGTSGGGAFDTVDAPDFGDGTALAITYDADGVRATRAYVGDATVDGGIGLHDYIVTANTLGEQGTWADGNFDNGLGTVDGDDLDAVVANFGLRASGAERPTASSDDVELVVDLITGELSLVGNATLRALGIASESGSIDPLSGAFAGLFSDTLLFDANALILGDDGAGVLLDGSQTLASLFDVEGAEDLEFAFGLVDDDELYGGKVSFIPEPSTATAFAVVALVMSMRRRSRVGGRRR